MATLRIDLRGSIWMYRRVDSRGSTSSTVHSINITTNSTHSTTKSTAHSTTNITVAAAHGHVTTHRIAKL